MYAATVFSNMFPSVQGEKSLSGLHSSLAVPSMASRFSLSLSGKQALQIALKCGKFGTKWSFITLSSPVWVPAKLTLRAVEETLDTVKVLGDTAQVSKGKTFRV